MHYEVERRWLVDGEGLQRALRTMRPTVFSIVQSRFVAGKDGRLVLERDTDGKHFLLMKLPRGAVHIVPISGDESFFLLQQLHHSHAMDISSFRNNPINVMADPQCDHVLGVWRNASAAAITAGAGMTSTLFAFLCGCTTPLVMTREMIGHMTRSFSHVRDPSSPHNRSPAAIELPNGYSVRFRLMHNTNNQTLPDHEVCVKGPNTGDAGSDLRFELPLHGLTKDAAVSLCHIFGRNKVLKMRYELPRNMFRSDKGVTPSRVYLDCVQSGLTIGPAEFLEIEFSTLQDAIRYTFPSCMHPWVKNEVTGQKLTGQIFSHGPQVKVRRDTSRARHLHAVRN